MKILAGKNSTLRLVVGAFGLIAGLLSCSQQEFSGSSARAPTKKTIPTPPRTTTTPPVEAPPPVTATSTDNGTIIGTPVEKVGIGFEDWTDWDFNDVYLCFEGQFNVNNRDIVSNRDQTVNVIWGTISAKLHKVVIKITEPDGSTSFTNTYQGVKKAKVLPPMSLPFKYGSKLHVSIDNPILDETSMVRAKVNLNWCNNTGN